MTEATPPRFHQGDRVRVWSPHAAWGHGTAGTVLWDGTPRVGCLAADTDVVVLYAVHVDGYGVEGGVLIAHHRPDELERTSAARSGEVDD